MTNLPFLRKYRALHPAPPPPEGQGEGGTVDYMTARIARKK